MKTSIKLVLVTFLLSFFHAEVKAQIEDHYHSFSGNMYIPIIVDHQEEMIFNDGRKTENNIPDKEITISVYLKSEKMQVKNGVFSGIIISNLGTTTDEVITYSGAVSKDKQTIKFIEITKESVTYVLDTREDVEKTITQFVRFENIPKARYGGFKYTFGVSKIAEVRYSEVYSIPRYGYVNSYTEDFVKVDEEKLYEHYSGLQVDFKPGVLELEDENPLTISGPDSICRGVIKERSTKKRPCKIMLSAKSTIPGGSFKWESDSEAILLIELIDGNGSEIKIRALAEYLPSPEKVEIKVTQKVGSFEFSAVHDVNLIGGYYYFWPDCSELYKRGLITLAEREECKDDLWDCEENIFDNNACYDVLNPEFLSLVLQEHMLSAFGAINPDTKISSKKLNWFFKLWDENGDAYPESVRADLREFVSTFPCMEKWVKYYNKPPNK